jgi:hypothetical protein
MKKISAIEKGFRTLLAIMPIVLETQARIVLIVCIVQIIFFQIAAALLPISMSDKVVIFFMILISLGVSTVYLTYSINCMVAGKCNMFAWILAGFVIFAAVFSLLSSTMAVTMGQQGFRKALMDNPNLRPYVDAVAMGNGGVPEAAEARHK